MAEEGSTLPALGFREVPLTDRDSLCKLCFNPAKPYKDPNDPSAGYLDLGPLFEYVVDPVSEIYRAHHFCLLFSSGLEQAGADDEELKGFLTSDVLKEWRRGQRLKCCYCQK